MPILNTIRVSAVIPKLINRPCTNVCNALLLAVTVLLASCADTQNKNAGAAADKKTFSKPNIVFVITDDQGYGDLSYTGNPIVKTPHIDALANESVGLNNYHVAPTCSPTRAALLTGHWTNRTGVWHTIMGRSMLRENEITIADMLKDNGYTTAMFGKWHLGDNYPYRPMDRGFDLAYYHGGGGVGQTPDYWNNAYFDGSYLRNGVPEPAKGFVTDVFFDETIKFIEQAKDGDKPFFAYVSANAPHGPMHAPQQYADMYADSGVSTYVQHFYGMITNIDDNVARLRKYLKDNGLHDNTIFIFTTDNGTSAGENVFNAGMRGKKGSAYDGGHRVPFFIHWPAGGIDKQLTIDTITSYVDIVPTLLEYTQSTAPSSLKFDGQTLSPLINGNTKNWPDRLLITDSQRVLNPIKWRESAVMSDRWRLINGKKLYDMDTDPGQKHDVSASHPEVVKTMRDFYDAWWADIEPSFGQPTAIYLGDNKANPVDLTSHDWLGENKAVPWNQSHIRKQLAEDNGKHLGYWWVKVIEAGDYSISLRRWPQEANAAINETITAGAEVAGDKSYRAHKGIGFNATHAYLRINDKEQTQPVNDGDKVITFKTKLQPGFTTLSAAFVSAQQKELGAYYVTVEKH